MSIQTDQIIGEVVAGDYRAASVFKKYGIDFCCQGNRTISDVCEKKNIDSGKVIADINNLLQSKTESSTDFQSWPIDLMTDFIEKKHHRYVEEKTQEIKPYLDKICNVHGDSHPELFKIKEQFYAAADELAVHMKKEELVLFPYIRKMTNAKQEYSKLSDVPHIGTVKNPIQMMMHEHSIEGERFRKIEVLSNNYTPPKDACNTYKVTFALLKEFEEDLHQHIHLENNILFPKTIELEKLLN
jgi:regulator of cell morphogenesis and NO signaling